MRFLLLFSDPDFYRFYAKLGNNKLYRTIIGSGVVRINVSHCETLLFLLLELDWGYFDLVNFIDIGLEVIG